MKEIKIPKIELYPIRQMRNCEGLEDIVELHFYSKTGLATDIPSDLWLADYDAKQDIVFTWSVKGLK